MTKRVKDGIGDYARSFARAESPYFVLARERLRRLPKPSGHIGERSARRELRDNMSNLPRRPRTQILNDADETDDTKDNDRHKQPKDLGETIHACGRCR